jgi:hypothetical protein
MRRRLRARKVIAWGLVLLLAAVAGAMGFAYSYVTDGGRFAALVRREAPRYLPGSLLNVPRVWVRPFLGRLTVAQVDLWQRIGGKPFHAGQIGWMNVECNLRALAEGRFQPTEILVSQPVLRLKRRPDGTWNLQGLLAHPWPAPPLEVLPVVKVRGGRLELIDGELDNPAVVLTDVEFQTAPQADGSVKFEGIARGGPFDRARFEGSVDHRTGRVEFTRTDITRLQLSDSLRRLLAPAERLAAQFDGLGLRGGEVDLALRRVVLDPRATPSLRYEVGVNLRGATLVRDDLLPFRLSDVQLAATLRDGDLAIASAEGRNGKTAVRVRGRVGAVDPEASGPLDLHVEVTELELDERLKARLPASFLPFWQDYRPEGWIDLGLNVVRPRAGDPVGFGLTVRARDVGIAYKHFPYPLQHVQGTLVWQGQTITIAARTLASGQWLTADGTVERPGPDAVVKLDFRSEGFPVDESLFRALPPEFKTVVAEFQPTGSVRGVVHLSRRPPKSPGGKDDVAIHCELDLNSNCSLRWAGLPYLVRDVTGHLDLKPDRWTFTNMKGRNGAAVLAADGEVVHVGPTPADVAVKLAVRAEHLAFDGQLRDALPAEWQATWATLNPSGASRVEATIAAQPRQHPHYHLKIVPEPAETRVQLALTPVPGSPGAPPAGRPPKTIQLPPMERVAGTFVYDDAGGQPTVEFQGVTCIFREAPVSCRRGQVAMKPGGAFELSVADLVVSKLRLDAELRQNMPPVMADFAERLDDGRAFRLRGDLGISWDGRPGTPARCAWENAIVVLDGNTVQTGFPLEAIQGQVDHLQGWSDGRSIEVQGVVNLASVHLAGVQVADFTSPLVVSQNRAHLTNVQARLLGGVVYGDASVSLDATPHYRARLQIQDADLAQYTLALPGRQDLRGRVTARVAVEGDGNDVRTCVGEAEATITQGNLGQLPIALQWIKAANFRRPSKTLFDAASVRATIADGQATLDPVRFTGDAFSLAGRGTVKLQGDRELDLRFSPLYGRDGTRVPILSTAVREASDRVLDVRVTGPLADPVIRPEPLPGVIGRASQAVRDLSERREDRRPR